MKKQELGGQHQCLEDGASAPRLQGSEAWPQGGCRSGDAGCNAADGPAYGPQRPAGASARHRSSRRGENGAEVEGAASTGRRCTAETRSVRSEECRCLARDRDGKKMKQRASIDCNSQLDLNLASPCSSNGHLDLVRFARLSHLASCNTPPAAWPQAVMGLLHRASSVCLGWLRSATR